MRAILALTGPLLLSADRSPAVSAEFGRRLRAAANAPGDAGPAQTDAAGEPRRRREADRAQARCDAQLARSGFSPAGACHGGTSCAGLMQRWRVLSAAWLAGCATSALEMAPDRPDRPWTPATTAIGRDHCRQARLPQRPTGKAMCCRPIRPSASVPPPPGVDATKVYSLPELIDLAESNNPSTRIAWNDARNVALAAGIAESAFLPNITASAVLAYQRRQRAWLALRRRVPAATLRQPARSRRCRCNGCCSTSASASAVVDAAKQGSVISNIAFTAAHQQLIYDVALAFYAHAAAQARLATATQSLTNAKAVQAAAEDRYKHEIGTVIEVAQARQATAQANLAVVQATGGAQDAYLALISAMGISPLTKIKIADASGRKLSPSMAAPVESIITAALARRPDVLSAYAAQKASLANVRAAQAEFMPKFFVSATGSLQFRVAEPDGHSLGRTAAATVNLNGSRFGGSIFAGVTLPLYDGGTRSAALAQARAEADSAEARLTRVRDDAVRQIVLADNALRTSLSAHSASEALAIRGADDVRCGAGRISQRRGIDHRRDDRGNAAAAGAERDHRRVQHCAVRGCDARPGDRSTRPGAAVMSHRAGRQFIFINSAIEKPLFSFAADT